ncbi:hypothetical protein GCK72_016313 [Caenorhabditis remanei]|uniref:Uncharacterized protein n=1 Tax=Caenorhabditis remanei TaxID=31234 RepID=A0A6A5GZA0_CAERE|nr:hypothetical protein GCK72_016313 [Caenorhabditis remanei]KAF1759846.1 hypothetical protein GCK72_016313 [Caenorhabditis remanei]
MLRNGSLRQSLRTLDSLSLAPEDVLKTAIKTVEDYEGDNIDENGEIKITRDAKDEVVKKVSIPQLYRYTTMLEKIMLFVGTVVALITGAGLPLMSILQGQVSQAFINEQIVINTGNTTIPPNGRNYTKTDFEHDVMNIVWSYAAMTVGMWAAGQITVTCYLYVAEQMNNRLRREFVKAILRQDISWFDTNHSGTLATKLFDNLERVKEGTGDKIGMSFQYFSQFITGFIVAFTHSWKLTLVMLAVTPLQALCGFLIAKSMSTFAIRETVRYAKAGKVVEETISSIRTVVSLNGLRHELERYATAVEAAKKSGVMKGLFLGISFGAMQATNFFSFALAFYIGVGWVHDGSLAFGDMLTTFSSVMMGSMALGLAGPQLAVLGTAQGAASSIYEVLDRKPVIDSSSPAGRKDMKIKGDITVENVHFTYPSRPDVPILRGMNLRVNAGQTVALVGSSGCGKSTIISLLLRYYDVLKGKISIDGVDVRDINLEFLRKNVAVVSQEPALFNCTIEENIRLGREDITREEMIAACKMANAEKFIKTLPAQYGTLVGDRGTQLSGGQKQRIAIARALVRNPKILLLDEATSALDAESEGIVQQALDKAAKGRTTIIIAHRLSTIRNADLIISCKNGQVVEVGDHRTLMAQQGLYYDLVTAQTFTDAVDASAGGKFSRENSIARQTSEIHEALSRQASEMDDMMTRVRSSTMGSITNGPVIEEKEERLGKDALTRLKQELEENNAQRTNLFEILYYAKPHALSLFIGMTAATIGGFIYPTYSVFFTSFINVFSGNPNDILSQGHFWALMFLVLAAAQGICSFLMTFFMGIASESLTMDLRNKLFRNVLSQHIGFFDSPQNASGKICTRLATDVPNLRTAIDFRFSTVITTIVSMIAGIGLAFYYGWQMALLIIAILPIVGFGQYLRGRRFTGNNVKSASEFADSGKIAIEAIENVRTVQALAKEDTFYTNFCSKLDVPHKEAIKEAFIQGLSYGCACSVLYLLNTCAYRMGLALIIHQPNPIMTPMRVLRVMYAITISTSTLGFATSYFPEYAKATFAGGIIFGMLKQRSKIDSLSTVGEKKKLSGKVIFKNVRFAYPERPTIEILKGLSFSVEPGQTLALVGPSGCGKSTVVALLERFYDTLSGEVFIDGAEIKTLNPEATRSQIAIVSQEPTLFDCSIAENIVYGLDPATVTMSRVEEAAKLANIHNFISELPEGYETRVGDRGTQLSGGQKQRIAIARALVRNPKILLLDEATSALDTESEKIVQDALDRAREGRTCIVIAHRLNTIMNADCIAVVSNGTIIEKGTHTELMSQKGAYFKLTQKQMSEKK